MKKGENKSWTNGWNVGYWIHEMNIVWTGGSVHTERKKHQQTDKTHKLSPFHLPFRWKSAFSHLLFVTELKEIFPWILFNRVKLLTHCMAADFVHFIELYPLLYLIESLEFFLCFVFSSSFFDFAKLLYIPFRCCKSRERLGKNNSSNKNNNVNYWVIRPCLTQYSFRVLWFHVLRT